MSTYAYGAHVSRRSIGAVVSICLVVLTGCGWRAASTPPEVVHGHEIQAIEVALSPIAAQTPILDVHTHTFNARYLPIEGILLGRRDKNFLTMFISDRKAREVARMVALAVPDEASREALAARVDPRIDQIMQRMNAAVQAVVGRAPSTAPTISTTQRVQQRPGEQTPDTAMQTLRNQITYELSRDERQTLSRLSDVLTAHFLYSLTALDVDQETRFRHDFCHRVPFMVSHMMDLAPVYNQAPDDKLFWGVERQVDRMRALQERPESQSIYFVAFSPFRDHWNGGKPGNGLAIVTKAINEQSAYGVKFYPPSGYRAMHNEIPGKPFAPGTRVPMEQWKGRYQGTSAQQLDESAEALLRYCETSNIPVFTHVNTGEFEARRGYGLRMADPRYWKAYLEKRSKELGKQCELRLCLGHLGGERFWFGAGDSDSAEWGRLIYELCRDYPNVYTEVGAHAITSRQQAEFFANRLLQLQCERLSGDQHPILSKIMYGSDWFMPQADQTFIEYLTWYQRIFLVPKLQPHYAAFFSGNALRYLDVERRQQDPKLHANVRQRLSTMLERYRRAVGDAPIAGANSAADHH